MTKRHVLICGKRGSGKTELTERLLSQYTGPVYGFRTKITQTGDDGYHKIYLFEAGKPDGPLTAENHVGDCNTRQRTVHPEVFDQLGVRLLAEAKADGIVLMDELGFMEAPAERFCNAVLDLLQGDIPVLATAKAKGGIETDFLQALRRHPKTEVYELTPENREEVYASILPWILERNSEFGLC